MKQTRKLNDTITFFKCLPFFVDPIESPKHLYNQEHWCDILEKYLSKSKTDE